MHPSVSSQRFIDFVRTRCKNRQGPSGGSDGRGICTLRLACCSMGNDQNFGEAAAMMLMGSSLQALHLEAQRRRHSDYRRFFRALSANAARIRLPVLKLGLLEQAQVDVLTQYLPTCLHLQKLVVTMTSDARAPCRALYQNASLCRVEVWNGMSLVDTLLDERWYMPFYAMTKSALSAAESQMVQLGCARNQHLAKMLAAPKLEDHENGIDGAADLSKLALFPTLFDAARQTPRTTLNNILIGVLAIPNVEPLQRCVNAHVTVVNTNSCD
jgi:hypothetical protein